MRRTTLPLAVVLSALLGLLIAAPASAATTGTFCGEVSAFTAPTATTDGSITIDGTAEVIDSSAFGVIDAGTLTVLEAVAAADATTCVEITANGSGEIVDIAIAAQAEICGAVTLDTATGVYSVAGVALPLSLVSADADLVALLDAALAAGADVCVDVTISSTTGLITTIALSATIDVCGDVTLDADSATVAGVDVPLGVLDANAIAALQLAADAGVDACVLLIVDDTAIAQANVTASVELCGAVVLEADGDAVVDGITIDAALLDAQAEALLALAAEADGVACVAVDASTTGGSTSVGVLVVIDVCAEVTAVTDDTVTIGGITFVLAGAADAGIEVGDAVCVTATTAPTGNPIIVDVGTEPGTGAAPGAGGAPAAGGGGAPTLPDTAVAADGTAGRVIGLLLTLLALGLTARRMRVTPAR